MRILSVVYTILVTGVPLLQAAPGHAQVLEKRLTAAYGNISLHDIMQDLQRKSGGDFAFMDDLGLDDIRVGSVRFTDESLQAILQSLLEPHDILFFEKDGTVYLNKKNQPRTITGRVSDESGKPLAGATVFAKDGGSAVATTDGNGIYRLALTPGARILVVSFMGYLAQEVTIGERATVIDVQLQPTMQSLEDVVVVGYGTQSRKDVTTAVASVKAADINGYPGIGIDKAMTGKLAGVQVMEPSGAPGSGIAIKVRGPSTITAGTMPLYVIDGVPMSDQDDNGSGKRVNSLNDLNINDVESIEVLKDASAAAIYGSRGSNGVVLITTKRGISGKPLISFNSFGGWQETTKKIDMLDAYEYAELVYESHNNTYLDLLADQGREGNILDGNDVRREKIGNNSAALVPPDLWPYLRGEQGLVNTDWQDQVIRQAPTQSYSLSLRGGSDNVRYYLSGNYVDQEGIVIGSGLRMVNGRLNLDAQYNRLKLGTSINVTNTVYDWVPSEGRFNDENIVSSALAMSPTMPVFNADGSYNFQQYSWGYSRAQVVNPVALAKLKRDEMDQIRLKGNVFADYELYRGLNLRTSFGYNIKDWDRAQFRPSTLPNEATRMVPSVPSGTSRTKRNANWVSETTLNFKRTYSGHSINAIGGFTVQREHSVTNLIAGTGYQNDLVETLNYATTVTDWSSTVQEWSLLSWLGRIQYNYKGRYLFSGTLRADGSSRFGPANRWGYFPSVSAGWNIAEEQFMDALPTVSTLKLRASYGQTGNFSIGNYGYLSFIGRDNYILGGGGGSLAVGYIPTTAGNDRLKWEKNAMVNLGADIGLFADGITLQIDVYNNNTSDMLLDLPVPGTSGFRTALRNIGKLNNKGVELTLGTDHRFGRFHMAHSANLSANRNKVVDLGGLDEIISSSDNVIFFVTRVGEPIASYRTLVTDGVYRNAAEVNDPSIPRVPGARPGDFRFVDQDGNNVIDGNDQMATGNYQPKFTYGYSGTFEYGLFDLGVALQGIYGNKIANIYKRYIDNMEGNTNNMVTARNRWVSEENPGDGQTIRANRTAKGLNGQISTWHIEDGSYLRIRNITLGVSLPGDVLKSLSVGRLRIYASVLNPFTFTKYSGYNPEVSTRDNPLTPGVDYGTYPLARSYNVGINLDF